MKHFKLRTDLARFMSKIKITDSCWVWNGSRSSKGYGVFWSCGKNNLAHRISFQLFNGPIQEKLMVCHSCDVRDCVNPDHLWIGTAFDNVRDAINKGRLKLNNNHNPFAKKRLSENQMIGAFKRGKKWRSLRHKNGKTTSLGTYDSQLDAHLAYMRSVDNN